MNVEASPPVADDLGNVLREYMEVTGRLQQTHEALQSEVLRLRQEIEHKDRELELRRRLSALGELAAGVAHEVRNPLGAIQLYSNLLRKQCDEEQFAPARRLVEKIQAGVQAIDAVVQDTLALAPRGRDLARCVVTEMVGQAREAALKVLTQRDVRLELSIKDERLSVHADPTGLQRVLTNLIVNAAEAGPTGSTVSVTVTTDAARVSIAVADEGAGLSDEVLDRIFDPFFTTKPNGTGLGLTIAHRLIEAYGGQLTAGNRPTGGAEFVIVLPLAAPESGNSSAAPDAREHSAA